MQEKKYIVPPVMQQKMLIGGLTIPEAFGLGIFSALWILIFIRPDFPGRWHLLAVPAALTALFWRRRSGCGEAQNGLYFLTRVLRFFLTPQEYAKRMRNVTVKEVVKHESKRA